MIVREANAADRPAWAAMRHRLWDDFDPAELDAEIGQLAASGTPYVTLVAETEDGRLAGFAEVSVRSVVDGCPPGPTAYLEGIWVEPEGRRRGVGRALLAAAEQWARDRGLSHFGSDALLDNAMSHAWHRAAGFEEVVRVVTFQKPLASSPAPSPPCKDGD
jgi:aminoglycoside 6'-N-acetyltransferase I